jgi:predicted acyl esterase
MRDIAYLVRPGHRLRLHIAGTSFPRLARNPNTGGDPYGETEMRPANITIHSTAAAPSALMLYVLPD